MGDPSSRALSQSVMRCQVRSIASADDGGGIRMKLQDAGLERNSKDCSLFTVSTLD